MPNYTVKVQPSGLLNDRAWPEVGESVDLPAEVGDPMVDAGHLSKPAAKKVEKRPASTKGVESRTSKE